MKASVISAAGNAPDRTVDVTIRYTTDANVDLSTAVISIPADVCTQSIIIDRMRDALQREILINSAFPLSDAAVTGMAAGIVIRIPG